MAGETGNSSTENRVPIRLLVRLTTSIEGFEFEVVSPEFFFGLIDETSIASTSIIPTVLAAL